MSRPSLLLAVLLCPLAARSAAPEPDPLSTSNVVSNAVSNAVVEPAAAPQAAGPQAPATAQVADAPKPADAEAPRKRSMETVVTATRLPTRADAAPRAITVVSREDLARRAPRSTPEALVEQEGVFLQKTNHGGGAPIIRGLYGQHILLLVDGVRMNNATVRSGPNQYLNTVDPFLVEQLEVMRGPGSVLYGSDALGGVVNVRTFWPRFASEPTPIAQLRGVGGTADLSLQGHVRGGLSLENTAVSGDLSLRDFNDLRGGGRVGRQRYTAYKEGDAALKLRHRFAPGQQLYVQYQGVRQSDAPRLDRSTPGDFRRFTEQQRDFFQGRFERTGGGPLKRWSLELSSHRQSEQVDRFRIGRNRLEREDVNVWTLGLRADGTTAPLAALPLAPRLVVGADVFHDKATTGVSHSALATEPAFTAFPQEARYPGAPSALASGLFGRLSTDDEAPLSWHLGSRLQLNRTHLPEDARMAGLFADAAVVPPVLPAVTVSAVGVATEVGVQRRLGDSVALLANLGSGFRAPNIDDYLRLGVEGPGFLLPSRDLRSEQSYTGELGVRLSRERVGAQLFYAYTVVSGLVGTVPSSNGGETLNPDGLPYLAKLNRDRARIHSVEGSVRVQPLQQLALASHATYTHTAQQRRDLTLPGEPLITEPLSRTAPLNGVASATWTPRDSLFFEAAARWALRQTQLSQADRLDLRICAEAPGCNGTPGFVTLNLRAGAQLGSRFRISGTLQNLLDATFRTHGSGVDEAGRSLVLAGEANW